MITEARLTPGKMGGATKRRRSLVNESLLTSYLLCAIIGGTAVAISPNLWILPVVAMVFYFLYGHSRSVRGGFVLEFADSLYYLGFTLTLMALFGSLEPFQWGEQKPLDPDSVMHHFGLGLITTLLGVIGRTALHMFYRTPVESIESINRKIAEEANDYLDTLRLLNERAREVLSGALGDLDNTLRGEIGAINASLASLGKTLKEVTNGMHELDIEPIREAWGQLSGSLRDASHDLNEQVGRLRDVLEGFTKELLHSAESIPDAGSGLAAGIQTLRLQIDAVASALEVVETSIREIRLNPDVLQKELAKLARVVDEAGAAIRAAGSAIASGGDGVARSIAGVANSIASVDLTALDGAVRGVVNQLENLAKQTRDNAVKPTSDALRELAGSVRKVREDMNQLDAVLDEIVEAVGLKLERIG